MPLPLARVLALLERLAPRRYAESWDNVGLLLGVPETPAEPAPISRVLFTIDLTEAVLEEARAARVELVVAYHPPLFSPLRKLDTTTPTGRVLLGAARAGIAVYSPHTALDAAPGGVNDWLAAGVGAGSSAPLVDAAVLDSNAELKLVTFVPAENADRLHAA
ncbi:MAG TPA: Nif3-like dinuclear metal center hexameric protein, partial [Polyangiaceae bacterium]|nr:Nif3-like dinuclear metal center hexameric protein [Polyangiaceae bacterium]